MLTFKIVLTTFIPFNLIIISKLQKSFKNSTRKLHIPLFNNFGFHFSKMYSFPAFTLGRCHETFIIKLCAHVVLSLLMDLLKSFQRIMKIAKLKDHLGQLCLAFVDADIKCPRVAISPMSFFQINECDFSFSLVQMLKCLPFLANPSPNLSSPMKSSSKFIKLYCCCLVRVNTALKVRETAFI